MTAIYWFAGAVALVVWGYVAYLYVFYYRPLRNVKPVDVLARELPMLWKYKCIAPGDAKLEIDTYFGFRKNAIHWLEAHEIFTVTGFDQKEGVIHFDVNWTEFREKSPCKWIAVYMGPHGSSTPLLNKTRSQAIAIVMGWGNYVLRRVDDQHRIIFYSAPKDAPAA